MASSLKSGFVLGETVSKSNRSVRVEVKGLQDLINAVHQLGPQAMKAFARALYWEAEAILADAKEVVPVDEGTLRDSGFAPLPKVGGWYVEQIVGFGGPAKDYALPVHEIPPPPMKSVGGRSARHDPPYGKGGQWKYLEDPFDARKGDMLGRVADDVAAEMGW
jgi:hypothetical protein